MDSQNAILAVFCDFENVAIGARDARYSKFDVKKVLERLLAKGSIVVKRAYCDWGRYESYKRDLHEASFELIDIPHLRQSGKNSADIRMVVDALDLCYTKEHVDTFVIVSGDSDFSPLVSKLRENNKIVIGLGVRDSTSDLFVANCDEFIFYDDLVNREKSGGRSKGRSGNGTGGGEGKSSGGSSGTQEEALELMFEALDSLIEERGEDDPIWGSMVKQTLKRQHPGYKDRTYGFRSFSDVLRAAQEKGQVELTRDDKSGDYSIRRLDS